MLKIFYNRNQLDGKLRSISTPKTLATKYQSNEKFNLASRGFNLINEYIR